MALTYRYQEAVPHLKTFSLSQSIRFCPSLKLSPIQYLLLLFFGILFCLLQCVCLPNFIVLLLPLLKNSLIRVPLLVAL